MESVIIKLDGVTKRFQKTCVLNNITCSFEQNKIHGIVGRNGSGKTVLFKCICGLMYPDQGTITVLDKKVGIDVDIPEKIGTIIEAPGFLPNYSGLRNLQFLAGINRKVKKDQLRDALQLVGLDSDEKKHVGKYSLGMRQRLGIAQAIMEDPDILILDEPFNGLDEQGVEDMRKLFLNLKVKGKTILLASHNADDISILCDQVYKMAYGKLTLIS